MEVIERNLRRIVALQCIAVASGRSYVLKRSAQQNNFNQTVWLKVVTNLSNIELLNKEIIVNLATTVRLIRITENYVCSGEKAMAPYSSTLAWKIPWTEEPGRLQSMGSQRVGHDWATSLSLFTFHFHALEKEMATHSSALAWRIPGMAEAGGLQSMGSHRVGHDWGNLAAAAAACVFGYLVMVLSLTMTVI